MNFHGIYLASGYSRRYGSNKLLTEFRGLPLYRYTLNHLLTLQKEYPLDITVVTQYREILGELATEEVITEENTEAQEGQAASIRIGVRSVLKKRKTAPDDYFLFFVADQPYLKKETIAGFLESLKSSRPLISMMRRGEKKGHPAAFSVSLAKELCELCGDVGGRGIVKRHWEQCLFFTDIEPEELKDIDRPEDFDL